jgi:hypothetical protein
MPAFQPYWGKPAVRMIGRIEETSASFEARSAPRSYPTNDNENSADVTSRILAARLEKKFGQRFVIDKAGIPRK